MKKSKIALALGGGGARGLAHIGVLKVLEREGIPIGSIVGTSMGALVGAAYAVEPDAVALEKRVLEFFTNESAQNSGFKRLDKLHPFNPEKTDFMHRILRIAEKHLFLSLAILRKALVTEDEMERLLKVFLPDIDIGDTEVPYAAAAVDLVSGREVILDRGPLIQAVMASCAVPGFMPPVRWGNMILADGAVINPLPAGPAKNRGAEIVIGVDVGACLCVVPPIEDGIDAINRSMDIMEFYLNRQSRECVDILIDPEVEQNKWTDFLKYKELIRGGEKAATTNIDEIRVMLDNRFRKKVYQGVIKMLPGIKGQWNKDDSSGRTRKWRSPKQGRPEMEEGRAVSLQTQPVSY
ncbi:MAG: patatin-like phospholipase family protein [Deltaproteobacteria bacterium]|nr:patatin-like phospholipase family protein [Deltaproteobacteria bacterium]MBW2112724.1 patatin-like phospholipase family protein [Deltaproteobacteria bacterium]